MSKIRFVHTDHLRLGKPLSGLAGAPAWLQQLATGAVRQAVRNVIETAIAQQAHFLLIAGDIVASEEDTEAAAAWLKGQIEPLRQRGIPVVAVADSAEEFAALNQACDLVLRPDQALLASPGTDGTVQLSTPFVRQSGSGDLLITIGEFPVETAAKTVYHAVPSVQPAQDRDRHVLNGRLTMSAGAVQAVSRSETWDGACVVVDAETETGEIQTCASSVDVIRFTTEYVSLGDDTTPDRLVPEVIRATNALDGRITQTVIVDWVLNARVTADLTEADTLSEQVLLSDLRNRLHSGHQGIWPRSVSFSSDSSLQLITDSTAAEEYFETQNGPISTSFTERSGIPQTVLEGQSGISRDLVTGLNLLNRVA